MSPPPPSPCFAVIAGGGTAGHVSPGLAIARALVDRGHPVDSLRWIGSRRGLEADLVPAAGFALDGLPGRGVQRSVKPAALVANVGAVLGLLQACGRAFALLRRYRPQVVLLLGGYASFPCVLAARALRIPIVVTEQNARAGASNRLAGRFAAACAVPFAETDLPRAVVTGNPVREAILAVDRRTQGPAARAALDLPADAVVIAVYSGSLGSTRINEAVFGLQARWADRGTIAIRHVTGRRDFPDFAARLAGRDADRSDGRLVYQLVPYEERVDLLLAAADLVVSRAGGNTVAELAQVGVGAVLVPLPIATRDHQTANAEVLVRAGAAVRVPDGDLDTDRLAAELDPLVGDRARLDAMAAAAAGLAHPDAADRVARLLEEHARAR